MYVFILSTDVFNFDNIYIALRNINIFNIYLRLMFLIVDIDENIQALCNKDTHIY